MAKIDLPEALSGEWDESTRPKGLFERHVSRAPASYVEPIIRGLGSANRRVQNGCAELASLLSEAEPRLLYPHVESFLANLDAREKVVRWEAVCTLGNLAAVDERGVVAGATRRIAAFLDEESIVLQGHAVRALTKIARAFPGSAADVLQRLVRAAPKFPGNRVGYLVEAMGAFGGPALRGKAARFLAPHLESPISSVASKARRAMRQLGEASGPRTRSRRVRAR